MPIDDDALNVWYEHRLIGYLWRDRDDRLGFRYDSAWLEAGFRLSAQLPLREQPFGPEDGRAHFFFANLLPEGEARRRLLRARRLPDNDFILLREFGGDCAGALSLLPVEVEPGQAGDYTPLPEEDLHRLVAQRAWGAFAPAGGARPRLSLAGAQDKCPVAIFDGEYCLPQGTAASSHILKFQVPDYSDVPVYEAFLNRLAKLAGLAVPETRLATCRDLRFLVVSRYDRYPDPAGFRRLHQEDFYQAAGSGFRDKYQAFGGPAFADCVGVLRELSEDPITDVRSLVRWQAFNVLAGNSDGHAKNLALLQVARSSDRWRLAPVYDLVCTRALEQVDTALGMAVAGEYDPDRVTWDHWRGLARECGLAARFVVAEVTGVAERLSEGVARERQAFEAELGVEWGPARVEQIVREQCARLGVGGRI